MLISAISLYVYLESGNIKKYFLNYLNNSLTSLLYVKDISVSYWETFPDISVKFYSVILLSSKTFNKKDFKINTDTLFKAQYLIVNFDVLELLQKNYVIKGVEIKNSYTNFFFDKKGNNNFQIFSEKSGTTDIVNLKLNKIKFINSTFYTNNAALGIQLLIFTNNFKLSGDFYKSNFTLKTIGDLSVNKLLINNQNYLKTKKSKLKIEAEIINKEIKIKKGEITLDNIKLSVNGKYKINKINDFIDFNLKSENLDIKKLLNLLNEKLTQNIKDYETNGICNFTMNIYGNISKKLLPRITSNFKINNGSIISKKEYFELKNINLSGYFDNSEKCNFDLAFLKIDTFYAFYNDSLIKAKGIIKNLNYPQVDLKLTGYINLNDYQKLFRLEDFEFIKGDAYFNLFINGKYKDISNITTSEIEKSHIKGSISLNNVSYKYKDSDYIVSDINSVFNIKNNTAETKSLTFKVYNTLFITNGTFNNVISYLLSDNEKLFANIDISIPLFDIKNFYSQDTSTSLYNIGFPEYIDINGTLKIDRFIYNNLHINNIVSDIKTISGAVYFNNLKMYLLEGTATGSISYQYFKGKHLIKLNGEINNVNVKKLFSSLNNFGQNYITDKNINGTVNATINICTIAYDSLLNLIENSLFTDIEFTIKNGQLINFEPLFKLSDYIALEEIRNIRFSDIKNNIFIKNRKIFIPNMEIKCNAFNIEVSGEHDFDNNINYYIRLYLKEWLGAKARNRKKENQEYGIIENDGLGSTSLYLNIKGNINNYTISYDKNKMKEQVKEGLKNEKQEIKSILKNEFGLFKKDSTIRENNKNNLKYKIEWDE